MDGEFEPICVSVLGLGITINNLSRNEHITEAERNVRTIKYRVRGVLTTLSFRKFPCSMIIEIVKV